MPEDLLRSSGPDVLAQLLHLGQRSEQPICDSRELAELLTDHLETLVEFEPPGQSPASMARRMCTIGAILLSPKPDLAMLIQIKDYAKAHRTHPCSPIPNEIATVLYVASVAAARLAGQSISALDDAHLRTTLSWAIQQPWLTPAIGELFGAALACLSAKGPQS